MRRAQSLCLVGLERHRLTSPQGVPILLSGREAMLVEQLARAADAAVARKVLDALFGNGADAESRRLDAALRRLRITPAPPALTCRRMSGMQTACASSVR